METSSCLELASGHDILTPECESYVVKQYLQTLRSHRIIHQSSSKDLQPIVASINVCLNSNSPAGKVNGLLALQVLVEDCSSQLFTQAGPSWVQQLAPLIKTSNACAPFFTKTCDVLSEIIRHAPDYAEVSKQITSVASNLVTSLIDCAKVNPGTTLHVMDCIKNLQTFYFGAIGPAMKHLEKFILENMNPWNGIIPQSILGDSFALLPKAGGGGKEGVLHKEAWDSLALKSVNTLDHLAEQIFSILPAIKNKSRTTKTIIFDLPRPKESLDLLRKSYFYSAQYVMLSRCVSRLLLSSFPHAKSVRPATFFTLASRVIKSVPLASQMRCADLETRTLFAVLPAVIAATMIVLRDLVKVCREDLLVFVPDALNLIITIANDLRQCSNSGNGAIPFAKIRIQLYSFISALCSTLGSNGGMEYIATTLIPLLVSDFLPPKTGVKLTAVSKKKASKKEQRLATRSDAETREGMQQKSVDKMSTALAVESLLCLGEVFKASGIFLKKSVHKNVQSILVGLCTEMQLERGISTALGSFQSPVARAALYSALLEVVTGTHPKWPAPVQFAIKIFQQGIGRKEENDGPVIKVCQKALSVCEMLTHPRSATLELEFPLDAEEVSAVKNESMKVHVICVESGYVAGDAFADQENSQDSGEEEMDFDAENKLAEDKQETTQANYSNEPGFDLLAGKGQLKRKVDVSRSGIDQIAEDEMEYAECEKLMKDVNSFENKISITIPDEVANRIIPVQSKRPRCEEEMPEVVDEGGVDLETMLGSFVDKTNDD